MPQVLALFTSMTGQQCDNCGLRIEDKELYMRHMEMHFKLNNSESEASLLGRGRNWCHARLFRL